MIHFVLDNFVHLLMRDPFSLSLFSPVKFICSTIHLHPWWIGFASLLVVIALLAANLKELVYFMVKVYLLRKSVLETSYSMISSNTNYYNISIHSTRYFSTQFFLYSSRPLRSWGRRTSLFMARLYLLGII